MMRRFGPQSLACTLAVFELLASPAFAAEPLPGSNPIIRDLFTADPAPLVVGDTVYLHVGHDEARPGEMFVMNEWLCYSSKDMKTWAAHGPARKPGDFAWAAKDAWAMQAVARNGRLYLYTTVTHAAPIGVAVFSPPALRLVRGCPRFRAGHRQDDAQPQLGRRHRPHGAGG